MQNSIDNTGGRGKSVFSELPQLAKFLQLIYFQNPDFKKFITILIEFDKKEIKFGRIIQKLISEYPNLFLNFFVKPSERDKVVKKFLKGQKDNLLQDLNKIVDDFALYNFFFAFKRHLVHLGILTEENKTFYGKKEDFDVDEEIWLLSDEILLK